jgi:hypothetical protein
MDKEQQLFEQWASQPCRSEKLPIEKHPNGAYKDSRTYIAFYGWKSRAKLTINAEVERPSGWYWVRKKDCSDQYGIWEPAYWNSKIEKFSSVSFGGVPESEFIVGQKLTAPDYNATLKAIADLKVFDNG